MKALTLHQPWASLVALGVKTIETRSWSTTYRGPLAIHAGTLAVVDVIGDFEVEDDTPRGTPEQLLLRGERLAWPYRLPRGAIVATCELTDVVPIVGALDPEHTLTESQANSRRSGKWIGEYPDEGTRPHQRGGLWLIGVNALTDGHPTRVEDQRPYGDFTPGRFAWLLSDVKPLPEPIPARGRQRLWEWDANG